MSIAGGCRCGAVRFEIEGAPITARQCWCRDCQYIAAGSATNNLFLKSEQLRLTGEVRYHTIVADSGNGLDRGFCPECGTPLTSQSHVRRHLIAVRIGALDDPSQAPPASAIWTSAAPGWACIDPALPKSEKQPPPVG